VTDDQSEFYRTNDALMDSLVDADFELTKNSAGCRCEEGNEHMVGC
jgi:hypothetical protein